jgi:hypothetical protein
MTSRFRLASHIQFGATAIATLLLALPAFAQQDQAPPPQQSFPQQQSRQAEPGKGDKKKCQEQASTRQAPSSQQQSRRAEPSKDDKNKCQTEQTGTSKDRLFFTLPNFLTVENAGQIPPLTAGQKFKIVARSSFDYVEFPWYAFLAGISQAYNSEPGYGQGAAGYGKRYGAAFADGTIENFWTSAILPSLLRQDPRFYQLGKGSFWHRTGYAVSRIFVIRSDSGNNQFNASEIFGSAIAAGISTYSYHPQSDRTLSNTASVWGTQIGYDMFTLVAKEFWPDIRRKISRKKTAL